MEALDFVDLPKVMECRQSFMYLQKPIIFTQGGDYSVNSILDSLPPKQSLYFEGYW